jgi:predicted naringenin-chalcone synthase
MMGFKLTNTGLQMILDIEVPDTIASHFPAIIHPFRKKSKNYGYGSSDISSWKKIVQTVEALFSDLGKNIDDTKEVLRLYGNMSSATVLYVLERFMDNRPQKEKRNVKFWPWIFSTTCFIAVLINNISHQILRFLC